MQTINNLQKRTVQNKIVDGLEHKCIFYTKDGINWIPTNLNTSGSWRITIKFYNKA